MLRTIYSQTLTNSRLALSQVVLSKDTLTGASRDFLRKRCTICRNVKFLSEYNTRPDRLSGYRSECKKCQYDRQYRRKCKNRYKIKAKNKVWKARKKGILKKPEFCEMCGEMKMLDGHHPDYNKPLEVKWLCRKCHSRIHNPREPVLF